MLSALTFSYSELRMAHLVVGLLETQCSKKNHSDITNIITFYIACIQYNLALFYICICDWKLFLLACLVTVLQCLFDLSPFIFHQVFARGSWKWKIV